MISTMAVRSPMAPTSMWPQFSIVEDWDDVATIFLGGQFASLAGSLPRLSHNPFFLRAIGTWLSCHAEPVAQPSRALSLTPKSYCFEMGHMTVHPRGAV